MLFNNYKFLETSKRIHFAAKGISVFDKSSNIFPLGGNGTCQVCRIRSGDLARFARVARFLP